MLNRNKKVKHYLPDRNTDFFDIVTAIPPGDTLAPYLFIICQDNGLQKSMNQMKENDFTLKKAIPRTNYSRYRQRRGHSASGKYTYPSRILVA